MLATPAGIGKLKTLIKSFFSRNGYHIQFNVISTETLRAAKARPHEYRDLMVRVAGFNAFFVNLDPGRSGRDHRPGPSSIYELVCSRRRGSWVSGL